MRLRLNVETQTETITTLSATLPPHIGHSLLEYRTRTGAVARINDRTAGAFDREHHDVAIEPAGAPAKLTLEVERRALPTNGLPPGPGIWWWLLTVFSRERPRRTAVLRDAPPLAVSHTAEDPLHVIGHSHLDVAWLWTYEDTRRKAQRTFAIACDLMQRDSEFCFIQSQPQLYAFVQARDPQLFEHVKQYVAQRRFDCDVAALWVESDCNIPSGESLLRQALFANQYCRRHFGRSPRIAWLPDSFGFANTLPQLLAHAGIPYFATTKLMWNDTTKFPYPQFVWRGPDGSSVVAALLQSYDGGPNLIRVERARRRNEPLVAGYGDGGGGVTSKMLAQVRRLGKWILPAAWFDELAARRTSLPVHADELYLEYHRGVYTTHHDVKAANALLERALWEAEELVAWCAAVGSPAAMRRPLAGRLREAWEIVLRNQFHDVLPGTSIEAVYEDCAREYAHAQELVASVLASAETLLPRGTGAQNARCIAPRVDGTNYIFENSLIHAVVSPDGVLQDLRYRNGENVIVEANILAIYDDRPARWEAWNVDDGYQRTMQRLVPSGVAIAGDALSAFFAIGKSRARVGYHLFEGEPFLRVQVEIDWRERRKLLRVENIFCSESSTVVFGSPHGTIVRSALRESPQERAKFEVPGQRFAAIEGPNGIAVLSLDTYGWSARSENGQLLLGHSLLRSTRWPDPQADIGTHTLSYAFAPLEGGGMGALEQLWLRFAHEPRVRLFTSDDDSVLVAACKPAEEGDGIVVRIRECNGVAKNVRLRCGARMTTASCVDALEQPIARDVSMEGGALCFAVGAYEIRSFKVEFAASSR